MVPLILEPGKFAVAQCVTDELFRPGIRHIAQRHAK